jgi:hypothetical protein
MSRKKLVIVGDRRVLKDYGFFFHEASGAWWYVFKTTKVNDSMVELSLRLYNDTDELRLHATNDHIKLPSMYNPKYNKDNYLELEEELDKFSFDEWIQLGILFELINDKVVEYVKPSYEPKVVKRRNLVLDPLDRKRKKSIDKQKVDDIIVSKGGSEL